MLVSLSCPLTKRPHRAVLTPRRDTVPSQAQSNRDELVEKSILKCVVHWVLHTFFHTSDLKLPLYHSAHKAKIKFHSASFFPFPPHLFTFVSPLSS